MRVIDAKKETWSLKRVGQGYNVVINRLDKGVEYHYLPVLVKLNEDQLIHVDPSTRKATLMQSSIKRSIKTGKSDELLLNFVSYLGGDQALIDADKVKRYVLHYTKCFQQGKLKSPEATLTRADDYCMREDAIL